MQRLNAIENLEIKHNEASLREKMKKLDELDAYTRTKIKNEIAIERVNYVTAQRTAIEQGLNQKIDQKTSLQAIKNEYDPIIAKIHSTIKCLETFFDCKRIYS